ncbi:MAG: SIMPL domain-containing protein [Candidatus Eremiobacteraeota bacterium]|nr:SIMPL domain-containing protein [Candidatus Eremiobacteraeota bacterium]
MKRTFFCLLLTLGVFGAQPVAAQAAGTEITASGSGSVSLPPDMATISAAVETNAENANDAIAQNNARYERIVAALAGEGVSRSDITLSYYNVNYNPRPQVMPPNPTGERYGYTVSRNFSVKVRKIGSAGRVSDACIAAGATAINGVTFGLSNPASARGEATQKAVAEARANAQAVAAAAGLQISSIKSIELGAGGAAPAPMMRVAAANAPTEFDQSNVNVTVFVTVVFLAGP